MPNNRYADILLKQGQDAANAETTQAGIWGGLTKQLGGLPMQGLQMYQGMQPKPGTMTDPGVGADGVPKSLAAPPGVSAVTGQPVTNPALAGALDTLSGHDGPIADLLKDPAKLPHLQTVFSAVKQDPASLQALAAQGIGPDKIQQFEQMLQQAQQSNGPAPHWLASGT